MKKTRFSEEQMVMIFRDSAERPVPEVAKKRSVGAQTIYTWRKHFGSPEATDMKGLRQLEQENQRARKVGADSDRARMSSRRSRKYW